MHHPLQLLAYPKSSLCPSCTQQSGMPPHSPHTSQHSAWSLMWQCQVRRRARASSPEFPCWQHCPIPGSPFEAQETRAGPGSHSGRRSLQSQRGCPHTLFAGVHLPWLPLNMPEHTAASRLRLSGLCFFLQVLNILLFAVFVRYSPESSPGQCPPQLNCSQRNQDSGFQQPREYPHARGCRRAVLLRGWHGVSQFRLQTCHRLQLNTEGRPSCRVGVLVHPREGKAD